MKAIAAAKGKQKALLAAAVLLVLAAAALLARQLLTVRIGDRRYPRAEIIDTRAALLSCEQYDAAAKESASAIRWLVPIGDERFDSFSEELVLSALPESEIDRLAYFPALRHVDAESCADYPALAAAAARFPAVTFSWHVPTADGAVDGKAPRSRSKHCPATSLRPCSRSCRGSRQSISRPRRLRRRRSTRSRQPGRSCASAIRWTCGARRS